MSLRRSSRWTSSSHSTGNPQSSAACSGRRRFFLRFALAAALLTVFSGHSPFRQWYVYRDQHLIVAAAAADRVAGDLAEAISARLRERLPDTRSVAADARDNEELIALLRSHQMKLVILDRRASRAALDGAGEFARFGSTPVRMLFMSKDYVLVALDDLPDADAARIAEALLAPDGPVPGGASQPRDAGAPIPPHSGAARALRTPVPER
jgi:hypothetical protein